MQQTYPPFLSSPLHPFPALSVFSTPPLCTTTTIPPTLSIDNPGV